MQDPYRVLNVPRHADVGAIKAAYRTLAKALHPDRNPGDARAERRFKEVTQAYQILSDPKKRAKFDRGEIDAEGKPRGGFGFGGFGAGAGNGAGPFAGFETIFEKAFGGGFRRGFGGGYGAAGAHPSFDDLLRGRGQSTRGPRRARAADIRQRVVVDFLTAARGGRQRVVLPEGRAVEVDIPPGTTDGQVLRLKGQRRPGSAAAQPGDLLVEIAVRPHRRFTRRGDDIHLELPISLPEAVLGAKIAVPTIEGRVRISVPAGSNSGHTLRLKAKGLARRDGSRGDQYVRLLVVLPERPDPALAAYVRRWAEEHEYDVRRDLEPA